MKLTFITVSTPAIKYLISADKRIKTIYGEILKLKVYNACNEMKNENLKKMERDIIQSDLVFVDLMGSKNNIVKSVYKALEDTEGNVIPYGNSCREYLKLGDFVSSGVKESKDINMKDMEKMKKIADTMGSIIPKKMQDMKNFGNIMEYFKYADEENIFNMLILLLREYGGNKNIPKAQKPRKNQAISIYDPKTMTTYKNIDEYKSMGNFHHDKPTVGLLFHSHNYPTDTSMCVAIIKEKLEEFVNVIPIGFAGTFTENKKKVEDILIKSMGQSLDLLINVMPFRLGAGPMGGDAEEGIDLLRKANVPYLHPFFLTRRSKEDWEKSIQGCTASEVMISVMLPELDGCIESYPVGATSIPKYNEEYEIYIDELEIIEERVHRLISRIKNHIALRRKKNEEKKIAIICYNYPPGESNLFGGAFLDTFASIENLVCQLNRNGYNVNSLKKEELMDKFKGGGLVNSGRYTNEYGGFIKYNKKAYEEEFQNNKDKNEIIDQCGKVPGDIMTYEEEFLIPGIIDGNVFIGLQPSRGLHEDSSKVYHDKTLFPHHQYQAFYKWIREEFKADAIIHVGTHGTLEFLKGKECGISGNCYEDKLIKDMPHMYLYYCGNPSEGVVAKRRAYANLIGYQPPVFVPGELYGEYSKIMTLVDNYNQSMSIDKGSSKEILNEIQKVAKELNLPQEIELLEEELYRINTSLIPRGLHVFGKGFTKNQCMSYTRGLLQYNRNGVIALRELVANSQNYTIEELLGQKKFKLLDSFEKESVEIFDYYIKNQKLPKCQFINKNNKGKFIDTLEYGRKICALVEENHEIKGLLKTLSGEYNEAKIAGDVYRNPYIMPTGYNLYQFDPRLVPTKVAYERGQRIAINTLEVYKRENGEYPKSTAVILWGLETSRTQGETFSQILAYLGVRLSKDSNAWEWKFEVIPIEELGRPRIDVSINICGFFRDLFSNLIDSLDDIFNKLYELDEAYDENYFKANSNKLYEQLIKEGYDKIEAKELALSRVFGPKEGEYGTGITNIIETKNWENEEQIGSVFLSSLNHVYNKNMRGKNIKGLYEKNLKVVDIVSQTRSNHEYEITDLDHYYEFFGGLSKSVEIIKGKKAKMYITDTTGEKIITEEVDKSIDRGIRTRLLNPKWVQGMLEHKYHGVQNISQRFENIMGLAATTNSVNQWVYNELQRYYVEDDELQEKLIENNPYAYMDMLEHMMEYYKRGYWNADKGQIENIKKSYLKVEGDIEDKL